VTADLTAATTPYRVVVNEEQQYSIWFVDRELPPGWSDAHHHGTKDDCLAYIAGIWTDIRPLSVRRADGSHTEAAVDEHGNEDQSSVGQRSLPCDEMPDRAGNHGLDG